MANEPENHTIRLLQEMRTELNSKIDDPGVRIDGVAHILTLMAGRQYAL
ncbi:hypothetical protein FACS1894205_6470 [Alphaproteobacteria bacterium]|nr:hypothetical protein FACS1894205_6470 [Alphaproteobacteria bacterium]